MRALENSLVALLVVLAIVVVLQNTESVETRLLFVEIAMPRAVLLFVTMLIGIVIGLVLGTRMPSLPKAAEE